MEAFFSLFRSLIYLCLNPLTIVLIIVLVRKILFDREYKKSAYYQATKLPYAEVKRDLGRLGEYLIYKYLKVYEEDGAKFLFNVYISKENGETTEIDVLMLYKKGIFVFESKNYSGWIFGDEKQKNWYQTLRVGRGRSQKESFYNPIMQNQTHIKYLKAFLGQSIPIWSFIVFSERCTLKNVHVTSPDIRVVQRFDVAEMVEKLCYHTSTADLSEAVIDGLYNKLYPFSQVNEEAKQHHISAIQNKLRPQPALTDSFSPTSPVVELPVQPAPTTPCDSPAVSIQELPQTRKCPKCNGTLILRRATRGANAGNQFYGCENYPRCKYIQNIEN